ncbi:ribosomal protein L1 [Polyplosphaeria fusca]|uniref:Ribosomal protein L1 n=1 Tax=Polyplosphaeria fusca TaxID=682080 RepID=A0A9P4R198_9PLEO|nr:ribosomal protein L1 [Polyplosphaeria fusca]
MAKSKSLVKPEVAQDAPLTSKVASGSPYQLDPAQVHKAATALITHMKKHAQEKEESANKKSLTADADEPEQTDAFLYLTLATKKHVKDQNCLKPKKVKLPHSIHPESVSICLITADPQRAYKNIVLHEAFPEDLRNKVGRVISFGKLRKKYNTFELKRQLLAEYDMFMADERIIGSLPGVLGKVFFSGKGKRPLPIVLTAGADRSGKRATQNKEEKVAPIGTPAGIAREIQTALNSTLVNLSASANTSIKVGKLSMTPQQVQENVEAVVSALTERYVPQGWRNIRVLHIKGPQTQSLPIWLADELWADEKQVLDEPWKPYIKEGGSKGQQAKRKWQEWEDEMLDDEEIAERRAEIKKAKKAEKVKLEKSSSISREHRKKLKEEALKSVQTPLIAG